MGVSYFFFACLDGVYIGVVFFFFFFDNRQYIFQRQLETNTARASSLQAKAIEAGRLLGPEEKEKLESSVYFAAS